MAEPLTIAEIKAYLTATGWRREPQTWRSASVWTSADGRQVLVPARDGMGDNDLRLGELLDGVAQVEVRSAADVAAEIGAPPTDRQTYRLFEGDDPATGVPLGSSVRALTGVRDLLGSAGRALVEGPHVTFPGSAPARVRTLLAAARLTTVSAPLPGYRVHLPLSAAASDAASSFARQVGVQLHDAVGSANQAAAEAEVEGDLTGFDDAVTAGVSANLCQALSDLGGRDRAQPFEIGFRWAYGVPAPLPSTTVRIESGRGAVLAAAAHHLRRLHSSGEATITGLVESLHDDANRADRWRIKVRGEVAVSRGVSARRTLWVRLDGHAAYDLAIAAHREQQPVQAQGRLSVVAGRLELGTARADFTLR